MKKIFLVALFACSSVVVFGQNKFTKVDEATTLAVFQHHSKALGENNIDDIMADYTEESIVITPEGTYSGLAEIRKAFVEIVKSFPTKGSTFNVIKTAVKNDVFYVAWSAKTPVVEYTFATDTFIIQGGKILRQTFAGNKK
ncbi:MAG: hypothetical protein RLZZ209_1064 [Bacteroidota bacterium]|jgi:hypothetical protein